MGQQYPLLAKPETASTAGESSFDNLDKGPRDLVEATQPLCDSSQDKLVPCGLQVPALAVESSRAGCLGRTWQEDSG